MDDAGPMEGLTPTGPSGLRRLLAFAIAGVAAMAGLLLAPQPWPAGAVFRVGIVLDLVGILLLSVLVVWIWQIVGVV